MKKRREPPENDSLLFNSPLSGTNLYLLSLGLLSGCLGSLLGRGLGLLGAATASGLLRSLLLGGSKGSLVEVNQLDKGHVGAVTETETSVKDAGVATGTISDLRGDHTEQLLDRLLVLQVAENSTTGVGRVLFGLGDKRLDIDLQSLGLGDGGLNPLVHDQRGSHV